MASINTIVKRKQYLWLGIVVVGTASAIGGALYLSDVDMSGNGETVAEQEPVPDMTGVVDTTFDDKVRQHATTEMQVTAAQMQKQYEEIRRELDVLNKQRGDDQRRIEKLGQDNAALAEQVKALGANPVTATGEPVPQMPASPPGPEGEPQPGNTPVSFPPQGSVAVPPPTAFYPGNGVTPPPQVTYQSVPVPTHASLKPVISMWLSIAIRGLLAMGENRNRRVWFFCDELPTLHKLPDLVEILPEARKFGGCYVFGIQSYAQLEDIYGEKAAATLFDVMNTRAFFRSPSHKIAEFAAGEIGEKEHLKASEQYSYGADPVRDGVSTGKDMERQTLVSYSDIQSLPDLTCYVTLPGPYPAVKLSLKYQTRPKVAPEFIPRDINPEMENRLSAVLAAREAEGRQMASLFEPDVPEVVSGEDVTQAEQPQQPVSPAINDKKSDAGVNVPAGGIEQELKMKPEEEMEQQLPPGISESGEVVDMAVYEAWQREQNPDIQQKMQRREEVNINVHRERGEDVEPGDDF